MTKNTFFLLLILVLNNVAYSQKFLPKSYYLVDSLQTKNINKSEKELLEEVLKEYHSLKSDTAKINTINRYVDESWDENIWIKYNQWILKQTENKKSSNPKLNFFYQKSNANAISNYGNYYDTKGDIDLAISYYLKSVQIQKKINHQEGLANNYNNLGYVFDSQGNVVEALKWYEKSLYLERKLKNKIGVATSLNNIGFIYQNQGEEDLALTYFYQALELQLETNDEEGLAFTYNNLGTMLFEKGEYKKSKEYFLKSLELNKQSGNYESLALNTTNIGSIYEEQGNTKIAIDYYLKSLKIYETIEYSQGISTCLFKLAVLDFKNGELKNAKTKVFKALAISKKINNLDLTKGCSNLLYLIFKTEKNWSQALHYFELSKATHELIINDENTKAAVKQQFKFQYDKKAISDSIAQMNALSLKNAEIKANKAISAKQKIQLESEKKQKIYLGIGLFIIAFFAFNLYKRFKLSQKQKNTINEQKRLVEIQHLELEETHQEISDSIKYAQRLQSAILPSVEEFNACFSENFILFKPKNTVSGDFYWLQKLNEKTLFAVADCTGHGVPGAMVSVVCSNALNQSVNEYKLTNPGEILNKTRELVIETFSKSGKDVKDGMDIALCSIENEKLMFSGANNPLWIIRNNELLEFQADKQPIGLYDKLNNFQQVEILLQKGDLIYLFSDGYADQFGGEKSKKLMYRPFKKLLLENAEKSLQIQKETLLNFFKEWQGENEQVDDVCLMCIKYM